MSRCLLAILSTLVLGTLGPGCGGDDDGTDPAPESEATDGATDPEITDTVDVADTVDVTDEGDLSGVEDSTGSDPADTDDPSDVTEPEDPGPTDTPDDTLSDTSDTSDGDASDDVPDEEVTPDVPIDTGPPEPCPVFGIGFPAHSDPSCSWDTVSGGLLGPDDYAILSEYNGGTCLVVPALPLPSAKTLTIEWRDWRPANIYADHEIVLDGKLALTLPAGEASLPFYRHLHLSEGSDGTPAELRFCAPMAYETETWTLDDIKVVEGVPPSFGEGFIEVIELPVSFGTTKQIFLSVADPDVPTDPFVIFPFFEVHEGPKWATINQLATTYDPVAAQFHNLVDLAPPESALGEEWTIEIRVIDNQGLHANRWLVITVVE